MRYFGGIEGGGTKIKCIIASDPEHVICEVTFPTRKPGTTLPEIVDFFKKSENRLNISLSGLGLGFFGPLDLDPRSDTYGWITTTPKAAWKNYPLRDYLKEYFSVPIEIETDVNAAALAEGNWGAAKGLSDFVYITVGTGIGGGIIINNQAVHGMVHPEIGHILLNQHYSVDPFKGVCPFHQNCLEGLASGPSLAARWEMDPKMIPDDHPAWDLEASYLGQAIHNLVLTCSPQLVIMGGGVMDHTGLIQKVRNAFSRSLNGYVQSPVLHSLESYIVSPKLGNRAGVLGAISLLGH